MVSTIEIFVLVMSAIVLGFFIWWYAVNKNQKGYLDKFSYARGANAMQKNTQVKLTCASGKEICVYRATQICSMPDNMTSFIVPTNYENPSTDPISSGLDDSNVSYGEFDPTTTVDLTGDLTAACNGKDTCTYNFDGEDFPNGMTCSANGKSGFTQLIATYICIPKGGVCKSYLQ